jgi:hypothetical protein
MVDIVLLTASFTLELCHQQQRSLREWDHKPNIFRLSKDSGLDLEKEFPSSGRGGAFFLTSLFIELIDRRGASQGETLEPSKEEKFENRLLGPTIHSQSRIAFRRTIEN